MLFALIRGFIKAKKEGLGSFWADLTRIVLYVLVPLSIVVAVGLASQGVVQNMKEYETVQLLEPIQTEDGEEITEATVPMGPAASQIAIKQLGTNGGGFFGTNSAIRLKTYAFFQLDRNALVTANSGIVMLYIWKSGEG